MIEPNPDKLSQAYQENAAAATETAREWKHVSTEANRHLGPHPHHDE